MNSAPEDNSFSMSVTDTPIEATPKTGELTDVIISATPPEPIGWLRKTLKLFGPGLVSGAADDDPSGIATYSSIGAQFSSSMLSTMPLIYPFMAAIQEISARMARVTGCGIVRDMRRFYPPGSWTPSLFA
jgi:Mn2+/Fe2+ NRAMP family transporter